MRFGLGPYELGSDGSTPPVESYEQMLEQAAYAEELGFDSVWLGENHFTAEGSCSSAETAAAAVESVVNTAAIGSPSKVIRMLRKYEEAGIDFFCARVRWDSTPRVDLHRCIRLLAKEVVPAFR